MVFKCFQKTHGPDNNVSPMSMFDGNGLCIMEVAEFRGIESDSELSSSVRKARLKPGCCFVVA